MHIFTHGFTVSLHTPSAPLPESSHHEIFRPSNDQTHPIYTSTLLAPPTPQPLEITVTLGKEALPTHLAGDLRIELLLNGIPIALKVFREVKFRGKGFSATFSGFRIGRTEERPFVCADPTFAGPTAHRASTSPFFTANQNTLPNIAAEWTENTVAAASWRDRKPDECEALTPRYPKDVPAGVAAFQVLVTVGRKFATLEKYFMLGATQWTAFYRRPPRVQRVESRGWRCVGRGGHEGVGSTAGRIVKGGDAGLGELEKRAEKKTVWVDDAVKKCVQAKEVEFVARLHMLRCWLFVVPASLLTPEPPPAKKQLIIKLRVPAAKLADITAPSLPTTEALTPPHRSSRTFSSPLSEHSDTPGFDTSNTTIDTSLLTLPDDLDTFPYDAEIMLPDDLTDDPPAKRQRLPDLADDFAPNSSFFAHDSLTHSAMAIAEELHAAPKRGGSRGRAVGARGRARARPRGRA